MTKARDRWGVVGFFDEPLYHATKLNQEENMFMDQEANGIRSAPKI